MLLRFIRMFHGIPKYASGYIMMWRNLRAAPIVA